MANIILIDNVIVFSVSPNINGVLFFSICLLICQIVRKKPLKPYVLSAANIDKQMNTLLRLMPELMREQGSQGYSMGFTWHIGQDSSF